MIKKKVNRLKGSNDYDWLTM